MQLIWLTDTHLDFVNDYDRNRLVEHIIKKSKEHNGPSSVVITGDIASASKNSTYIFMDDYRDKLLEHGIKLYFVLGNHDYYDSQIATERSKYANGVLAENWLGSAGVIPLTTETYLVGHDGWYDGGYANWFQSNVIIPDYTEIFELSMQYWEKPVIFDRINALAKESAEHVLKYGHEALSVNECRHLYIATHVPPFRDSSVYNGLISDDHWMPHFSSKHMGDAILQLGQMHPDKRITVLCGHSHGQGKYCPTKNIVVHTGKAKYRYPNINRMFILD